MKTRQRAITVTRTLMLATMAALSTGATTCLMIGGNGLDLGTRTLDLGNTCLTIDDNLLAPNERGEHHPDLRDQNNQILISPVEIVVELEFEGGTSWGTIDNVRINSEAVRFPLLRTEIAGTETEMIATLNGQALECTAPTFTVDDGLAVNIEISDGNEQEGDAGDPLPVDLEVLVVDDDELPLVGETIEWTISMVTEASVPPRA